MPRLLSIRHKATQAGTILFCALIVPLWLWAVRAPDAAYAPLPDYDIRGGYRGLAGLNDPRVADEIGRLRQQRAAKLALVGEKWEAALAAPEGAQAEAAFGRGVLLQWNANGTVGSLTAGEQPLAPPQPGLDPEAVARQFLRTHQLVLGLNEATVASLQAIPRGVSAPDGEAIVFRQTVAGVPVFQAELKVSLRADNAVEAVAGTVYPALNVSPGARLSAVDAAVQAADYVGRPAHEKLGKKIASGSTVEESSAASGWAHTKVVMPGLGPQGEFAPAVVTTEAGPEERTTLTQGPFAREVTGSRVIFPLTTSQGREAWQFYLMKSALESYLIVVDAEGGTLLNRTSLVKFSTPQGLVFLTNPDAGPQEIRSFVGNPRASRGGFVYATQSGLQGNNVIMGLGANDTVGPRHFEFAFTDDYETSGGILNNFNLNGVTLQFTPNSSGGYDLTFPGPPAGFGGTTQDLGMGDEEVFCGADPAGFKFFGASTTQVCVSSNGNVTVNGFSSSIFVPPFDSVEDQLSLAMGRGRIMGLWDDLDPSSGAVNVVFSGSGSNPSALCFEWDSVPEFGTINTNNFSICMFGTGNPSGLAVGTIQLHYISVDAQDGMVGIAPGKTGKGQPRSAGWSDFSGPTSTLGAQGLARLFPDHDDAAAAATNLFWVFNELGHDREYLFGFTDKFRNMQWKNKKKRGRTLGKGKDPVVAASGYVAEGFDVAFFATTPEGVCCPISAFGLFTTAGMGRNADSAFDSDVVVHEYGHGVSTRLARALNTIQAGAVGEGWSDWFALDYSGDPVMGEYVTGNASTGLRTVAYDDTSPYTFGHFGNLLGPFTFEPFFTGLPADGTVFYPEVHQDGEIWATMLSELRTGLRQGGILPADISKLIIKALKKTPANASMLQARDALLTARQNTPISACSLWQVFAGKGFGFNAANNEAPDTGLASDSFSVFQSFNRPSTCGGSFSIPISPLYGPFNFDSAAVGASADGWTGTGLWHISDDRRVSLPNSFYFGVENLATYSTGSRAFGNLTSPTLDLFATTHPVLEMSLFMVAEEFFPFDMLYVRVSTDGGATFPIQRAIFLWDTNGAFRPVRIDLEQLAGQANVRIQFYFETFDGVANSFEGVYIDNVAIRDYTEN